MNDEMGFHTMMRPDESADATNLELLDRLLENSKEGSALNEMENTCTFQER